MPVSFDDLIPTQQKKSVSFDDLIPQQPQEPSTMYDVGASLASGVGRGAAGLIGLPGTIGNAINDGLSWATGMQPLPASPFSSEGAQSALSTVTGGASDYQPQTTAGEYAGTVGEFLPGAALGGANLANLVRFGVVPGLASEGAGQLTEGSSIEPYARIAAALVAPAVPALASRAVSPFSGAISPERQALVDTLRAEGVNPTAGQVLGSKNLRTAESELGGGAAKSIADDQARAFTEAAMSRGGQQGIATPENMVAMSDRIGDGFNAISARNTLVADQPLAQDLAKVITEYDKVLPTAQKEVFKNMTDDVVNLIKANNGTIPGELYQKARSRFTRLAQSAKNSDPEYANAWRGVRDSLDKAMDRSIKPADAGEWAKLRSQYGIKKTLEKAASGAGESAAEGFISPAKLRGAVTTGRQGQYVQGTGELDALARAGQILSPLPDSGTASRTFMRNLGASAPTLLGAGAGGAAGGGYGALLGAAAGAAVPAVAGRALMSRPIQSYLTNQLAPNMSTMDPRMLTVIQALISNQQGQK